MKINKYFLIAPGLLILLGVFLLFNFTFSSDEGIVFSEICPRNCATKERQWIEIFNNSADTIDITGWNLFIEGESLHRINLTSTTNSFLIDPNEFAVIVFDENNFLLDYPDYSGKIFDSTWTYTLSGTEDKKIGLKNKSGDFVGLGMPFAFSAVSSSSLERVDFNLLENEPLAWIENISSPTPGQSNFCLLNNCLPNELPEAKIIINKDSFVIPTQEMIYFDGSGSTDSDGEIISYSWTVNGTLVSTSSSFYYTFISVNSFLIELTVVDNVGGVGKTNITIVTTGNNQEEEIKDLLINEFLIDPLEGSEWVEIYNNSSSSIDLSNWSLFDGVSKIGFSTSTIEAGSYFIWEFNNKLNNTGGDIVILKNNENIVDSVCYGNYTENCLSSFEGIPKKGNSLARDKNIFYETTTLTKGGVNIITSPNTSSSGGGGSGEVITTKVFMIGEIVINELVSDPGDDGVEFVELYNKSNEIINLNGAWIEEGSEAKTFLIGNISPQGFVIVEKPKGNLNNTGDIVILYNSKGEEIDRVTYGTYDDGNLNDNAPVAKDPFSLARRVDGQDSDYDYYDWVLTSVITPGVQNKIVSLDEEGKFLEQVVGDSKIIINEIFPNPVGSDEENEFIELKNIGDIEVDLTGWFLSDATNKKYKITQGKVSPQGLIIFKRKMTKISLNNSGEEEVKLYSPNGTLVDSVKYSGSVKENFSYAKKEGVFFWTSEPTPEKENIIKGEALAPLISIEVKTLVTVNESILFDASDTVDPDNEKLNFEWDFGDGNKKTGIVVEHKFSQVGVYNVVLTVTDESGNKSIKKVVITVKNLIFVADDFSRDLFQVILSEVVPNPVGSDEAEFVELYNKGLEPVDLSGLKLDDEEGGSKPYTIPEGTIINSGEYLVFPRTVTKLAFNNITDKVRLLDSNKNVLWEVLYDDAVEGGSFIQDENENWQWSGTITPGKENIFSPINSPKTSRTVKRTSSNKVVIETTLGQIRNEDLGDLVKVSGIVAVMPGVLGTQFFYIVDDNRGVQIYMNKKDFPDFIVGDMLEVTGELGEIYGETRIKVKNKDDIQKKGFEKIPVARVIEIVEVGEANEGSLVEVSGEVTEIKGSYLYLDDGTEEVQIYFKTGAKIDKNIFKVGDLVSIKGLVHQTKSGYQILPRFQMDLEKVGVAEDFLEREEFINSSGSVAEKYLTATAGGLTSILFGLFLKNKKTHILTGLKKLSGFGLTLIRRKTK